MVLGNWSNCSSGRPALLRCLAARSSASALNPSGTESSPLLSEDDSSPPPFRGYSPDYLMKIFIPIGLVSQKLHEFHSNFVTTKPSASFSTANFGALGFGVGPVEPEEALLGFLSPVASSSGIADCCCKGPGAFRHSGSKSFMFGGVWFH